MTGWQLIEQLTEALGEEHRGRGSVDETALAIGAIAERLAALEGAPARPVRVIGPAIYRGHPREWLIECADDLLEAEGLGIVCPWPGCSSTEFQQAWKLWSVARSTSVKLDGDRVICDVDHCGDEVIWDSAHGEQLECCLCCRPVSVEEIRER